MLFIFNVNSTILYLSAIEESFFFVCLKHFVALVKRSFQILPEGWDFIRLSKGRELPATLQLELFYRAVKCYLFSPVETRRVI